MKYHPTMHFRWVRREEHLNSTTAHFVTVLQQGWAPSTGGLIDWRDVPMVDLTATPATQEG